MILHNITIFRCNWKIASDYLVRNTRHKTLLCLCFLPSTPNRFTQIQSEIVKIMWYKNT